MIHTEKPVIASDGSRRFDGYLARPAQGKGPGLLIFSEMWGVAPSKTAMADDYARRGWCAFAPNMFWRSEFTGVVPFDKADLAWERLKAFDWDRAVDDARTAAEWLRATPSCTGKIAAIGFCMGGRTAFLAASRAGVDAAVSLYALGIAKHLDEVRNVAAPVQFHYGLDDEHIPREPRSTPWPPPRRTTATSKCIFIPARATASSPKAERPIIPTRSRRRMRTSTGCCPN